MFESNVGFSVGGGRKIRFWEDAWIGHSPLKDIFQDIHSIFSLHNAPIADFSDAQGWNLFLRRNLNDWEIARFFSLLQSFGTVVLVQHKEDSIIWRKYSGGIIAVKSCYMSLTSSNTDFWPWRKIWLNKAP